MEKYFNSTNLLRVIIRWKYHLLIIVGLTALLSGFFSGPTFITPLYKSYAIAYPANIAPYSEESETEQMLQIVMSQDITDSMIIKFNLAKHYGINPKYKYFRTAILGEYRDNVKIEKTPYEAVKIEVMDRNPDTAALMTNAILNFYNKKVDYLHKSKYYEVTYMYSRQLARKRATMDSLKTILRTLGSEHGIFEYDYQSQQIMKGYLRTIDGNPDKINSKEAKRLMKSMEQYSGQLVEVVEMLQDEARAYVEVKLDYEMAQRFIDSHLTYYNVVTSPYVTNKKVYPIRWLIVVAASFAVFALALFIIFLLDRRKFEN